MRPVLRVGSRGSPLALRQTELALRGLLRSSPGLRIEIVPMRTEGDRRARSGDFTDQIDAALERGEVDVAVHSAKDLPVRLVRRVVIAATPRRGDPRDALVLRSPGSLATLRSGARLGSSSVRRRAELLSVRPDLEVVELHGNVGTRLARLESRGLDGIVLAVAGLTRLGLEGRVHQRLPLGSFLPSPGQGTLAVLARSDDWATRKALSVLDHAPTHAALEAERAFGAELGADCDTPIGALARRRNGHLELRGVVLSRDGSIRITGRRSSGTGSGTSLGRALARELLSRGAAPLLTAGGE